MDICPVTDRSVVHASLWFLCLSLSLSLSLTHTHIHTNSHMHTHTRAHTQPHPSIRTHNLHTHTHTCTYTPVRHAQPQTQTLTQTPTHTHAHAHTHTLTLVFQCACCLFDACFLSLYHPRRSHMPNVIISPYSYQDFELRLAFLSLSLFLLCSLLACMFVPLSHMHCWNRYNNNGSIGGGFFSFLSHLNFFSF